MTPENQERTPLHVFSNKLVHTRFSLFLFAVIIVADFMEAKILMSYQTDGRYSNKTDSDIKLDFILKMFN